MRGSIVKTIIYLSVPSIIQGAVQAFIPFVDTLFIYITAGSSIGASIGFVGPILNTANALGAGLGVAGIAIIGQAVGEGKEEQVVKLKQYYIITVLSIGILACIIILLLSNIFLMPLQSNLKGNAKIYLLISALGIPFNYFGFIYNAIAASKGKLEKSLNRYILILLLKLSFNIIYISILKMGSLGAGLSGITSNIIVSIIIWRELYGEVFKEKYLNIKDLNMSIPFNFIRLGIPSALTQASNSISFYIMNTEAAGFGQEVLNGFGIANTSNSLFFSPASAIGNAVASGVSITTGAEEYGRAKRITSYALIIGALVSILFASVLVPVSPYFVKLFSHDPVIVYHANNAMQIFSISIIGFAVFNIIAAAHAGIGRSDIQLWIAVIRIWILRIPSVLLLNFLFPDIKEYSIWLSMAISNFGTALISLLLLRKINWKHRAFKN